MTTHELSVSKHYAIQDLETRVLAALEAAGKDLEALSIEDLAPIDAFHIRGRAATEELAGRVDLGPDHLLLDVGCGLGGTSRYLAATAGCKVFGLDLTEEYCRVAEMLSARVGLADRTDFRQGSALALPFEDGHFDVVWTEHVQMNIEDKAGFYADIARVLKPGGQFAFHDIFADTEDGLRFPVPWASDASLSHLITVPKLRTLLQESGLVFEHWEDMSEASMSFFRSVLQGDGALGQQPLSLNLLMGETTELKFTNLLRNLEENRVRVVQGVMRRGT